MAGETTNPGYIEAQAYATAPSGNAPDQAHQEHGRGVNSYNLEQAGEAALLAGVIDVNSSAPTPSTTIDASGNLLVGKTALDSSVEGVQAQPSGVVQLTSDNVRPLNLNRLTSDGEVITFAKDGTTQGEVKTNGSLLQLNGTTELSLATGGTERSRIDASGNVLIGKTSPDISSAGVEILPSGVVAVSRDSAVCMVVNRITDDGDLAQFRKDDSVVGSISTSSGTTTYGTTSDYRLKENVTPLTGATDRLKQLPVKIFNFIAHPDRTVDGFLAHEVQAVVPEAVQGEKDARSDQEVMITPPQFDEDGNVTAQAVYETQNLPAYQQIDQSKLVPLLVATIQELEARITALEA